MFNLKNSNAGKIKVKVLAVLLILSLTFANFALLREVCWGSNSNRNQLI